MKFVAMEYDLLHLCDALERSAGGATAAELQVFCYLGSLISIYAGEGTEDWLYQFSATPAGAPYSRALAGSLDGLRARGLVLDVPAGRPALSTIKRRSPAPTVLVLSDLGHEERRLLSRFPSCATRERFLEAAGATTLTQPLASVTDALSYEPGLRRALDRMSPTALLEDASLERVLEQFSVIHEELGADVSKARDLLVPVSIWLSFLSGYAEDVARAA
jgi:hypothetical protein